MASPAVAIPNGVATSSLNSPNNNDANATTGTNATTSSDTATGISADNAQSFSSSSSSASASTTSAPPKRKREEGQEDEKQPNHHDSDPHHPGTTSDTATLDKIDAVGGIGATKARRSAIRDYFEVLQRYDATPSVLKRPLPDPDSGDEPEAKRKRSEDQNGPTRPSIVDKVSKGEYEDLDALIFDIKASTDDQVAELRTIEPGKDPSCNDEAIARTLSFKQKANELFRRELTYPKVPEALQSLDSTHALQTSASGNVVLSVHGLAPRPTQLYSSLQHPVPTPDNPEGSIRALSEKSLPGGIRMAKAMPYFFPSAVEKDKKSKTLGELFPPPRNLPSLQPPKAPKSTTKGVQVGWHRPELTEKSKYRAGSFSSQPLTTGRWLDYSNAAPPSQIITKQRERALSLAGTKPSPVELEVSELESLFRGAFSSFAPSKDDSAATIPSGMISQTTWWQKVGKRSFDRLLEAEYSDDIANDTEMADAAPVGDVDESLIEEAIENWEDDMVDPGLEEACCPKKTDEEKGVDDVLQDVSDMIQTLISYQRNRNLQLPAASGQSRYAADPAHSDMLTNGTPVQPSEDETATYQALKERLVLVIQMLPPYAVARLNSDKLDELNISTKMEVRTDEYQGVMEEDEAAARARAASAAVANPRPTAHRSSSSSSNLPYGQQYPANRAPMPSQPYYGAQTPVRQTSGMQRPPQTMPPTYSQRPPSNTGYRPPNPYPGTPYAQQLAKSQAPYTQPGSYAGTPTQGRPPYQQYPGYPNNATGHTPQARYPSYAPNTQAPPSSYHHQQPYQPQHPHPHPHQQPATPSPPPYAQYTNGTGAIPQRTASPHIPHQPPQQMHQQAYNPSATPSRQPSYTGHASVGNNTPQRFYPSAGSPAVRQHRQPPPQPQQGGQSRSNSNNTSFQTSLSSHQVQQAMDQAKARFESQKNAQRPNEAMRNSVSGQGQSHPQVTAPVGLGGIGLGTDPARMAAGRANMSASGGAGGYNASSPSPKPQANHPNPGNPPPAVNGSPTVTSSAPTANGAASTVGKET
ncbi:hypothetical protein DL763_010599 [Monosporascus cannonballus]|nr:hypothetical protein DL763_010599 [Monosporascus cannonballus]